MNSSQFNQDLIDRIYAEQPAKDLRSIKDYLRWCYSSLNRADIFYGHGYDNAWDEAKQLVFSCLQLPPDFPEALYNSALTQAEKEAIIQLLIQRIKKRIPIAYLTNSAWFCGLEFYIDERVIVPRSPISALIQEGFKQVLSRPPARILDMCTGSGCIAIACAEQFPEAEIDAVDISIDALNVTEINIERYQLNERVIPIQSDLFEQLPKDRYDLIVTNPPYVDQQDLADMPEEFHHEPEISLGSGEDGLWATKQILKSAADYLSDDGVLVCEVGNSMLALISQFPNLDFQWLELKNGGIGVFALTKKALLAQQYELGKSY